MATINEEQIINILKQCFDPEIPVDLWNLGLIYNIKIHENASGNSDIDIIMTLTTPGCTMGNVMAMDIKSKLESDPNVDLANIEITFEPPWAPEMMSNDARVKLGFPNSNPEENKQSAKQEIKEDWE